MVAVADGGVQPAEFLRFGLDLRGPRPEYADQSIVIKWL
jgi:hypothetical protein